MSLSGSCAATKFARKRGCCRRGGSGVRYWNGDSGGGSSVQSGRRSGDVGHGMGKGKKRKKVLRARVARASACVCPQRPSYQIVTYSARANK